MTTMLSDAYRFWRRSPVRGALLLGSCALILALTAANTLVLRASLWFTPPGVESKDQFASLGQHSPEGRFLPVAEADLHKLDDLGFKDNYLAYGPVQQEVRIGGKKWPSADIGLVSDNFFVLLAVGVAQGRTLDASHAGVVLSHAFWKSLGSPPEIVNTLVSIGDLNLSVVGVAAPSFIGLGDAEPDLWVSQRYASAFFEIDLPLPPAIVASAKTELVQSMPLYYGIVRMRSGGDSARLSAWRVRDSPSIVLRTANGPLTLGFNARGHRPVVNPRIDLTPDRTQVVVRYLSILAVLNASLAFLAVLNLLAFWTSRASERSQEIQIRVAVGAKASNLLKLFVVEAAPFLTGILLLALPLAFLQVWLLRTVEPFDTYLVARGATLGLADFAPGFVVLLSIGVVAVAAPWLNLRGNALKSRALGAAASVGRLRNATSWTQWVLTVLISMIVGISFLVGHRLSNVGWGGSTDPQLVSLGALSSTEGMMELVDAHPEALAAVQTAPLTALQIRSNCYIAGGNGDRFALYFNRATASAFPVMGLELLAGKLYERGESGKLVISESAAKRISNDIQSVIGRQLVRVNELDDSQDETFQIVGVVTNVHYDDVRSAAEQVGYLAVEQVSPHESVLATPRGVSLMQAHGSKQASKSQWEAQLAAAEPISAVLHKQSRTELLLSWTTMAYAAIALALMLLGLLAQARTELTQQSRSFALRVAVGAKLGRVTREFITKPALLALSAVLPMLVALAVTSGLWIPKLPLLHVTDWTLIAGVVLVVVTLFSACLAFLARRRLGAADLANLLRVER